MSHPPPPASSSPRAHAYPQELPELGLHPSPDMALFLPSVRYTLNVATPPKESGDKEASGNSFWLRLEKISCCLGMTSVWNAFLLRFTTQCPKAALS